MGQTPLPMGKKEIEQKIMKRFAIRNDMTSLPWCMSQRYTRYHLGDLLGELGYTKGAEIGVRRAKYSKYLCEKNPNLTLFCVDPWTPYNNKYRKERQDRIYQEALKNTKGRNIKIIRKNSFDALADFEDGSLDFVFIDGNHTFDYVAPDIIYWSKKVRKNGMVIIHDYYSWSGAGVREAVDAYTKCNGITPWFTTKEHEPTAFWVKP